MFLQYTKATHFKTIWKYYKYKISSGSKPSRFWFYQYDFDILLEHILYYDFD
jgi:hypothetical protein